jgi:hypothetical protein
MTSLPPIRSSQQLAHRGRARYLFVLLLLLAFALPAHAQHPQDIGLTFTQSRSNFVTVPGSATQYFYLRGAAADYNFTIAKGIGVGATAIGTTAQNLGGHVDIHQVSILAGPRYTCNLGHILPYEWGRKGGIFGEGKVGYTFATSGQYVSSGTLSDSATALTYLAGGGINLTIYHHFDLRLIEADFIHSQLPNGFNNSQSTLRLAIGINFHTQD